MMTFTLFSDTFIGVRLLTDFIKYQLTIENSQQLIVTKTREYICTHHVSKNCHKQHNAQNEETRKNMLNRKNCKQIKLSSRIKDANTETSRTTNRHRKDYTSNEPMHGRVKNISSSLGYEQCWT